MKKVSFFLLILVFQSTFVFAAKVTVVRSDDGWRLLKDGEPYFVKGVCYSGLNEIGKSPQENTMRDWMIVDDDQDGRIDVAYQAWLDKNFNNVKDRNEPAVGDFQLMKEMGVNTVRLYHLPSGEPEVHAIDPDNLQFNHAPNKKVLRQIHEDTGIMFMVGDFLGAYTLGSGALWSKGTDYRDPGQAANMMRRVHDVVMEFKDEPYVLAWALGNENNYAHLTKTNASQYPVEYAQFVNKVARYIKQLDSDHPVVLVNGETINLDVYQKHVPDIDIIGINTYRHWEGFNTLWKEVDAKYDKPVLITEYGVGKPPVDPQTKILDQQRQARVHKRCWEDIYAHGAGGESKPGNALGGFVFVWVDDWWQSGNPGGHDVTSDEWNYEWHGIMSQGMGKKSPLLRQARDVYFMYQELWRE